MFSGESFTKLGKDITFDQAMSMAEDATARLGSMDMDDRGHFTLRPRANLQNMLTRTTIDGVVKERGGTYSLSVYYTCTLSGFGWVILILGILFMLIGLLVLLAPYLTKNKVQQEADRGLRELA